MLLVERLSEGELTIRFKNLNRLTIQYANELKEEIEKQMAASCRSIVLDLEGIHFIDAKSFEMLRTILALTEKCNATLRLKNVSDETWELIEMMHCTQVFDIERVTSETHYHPSLS